MEVSQKTSRKLHVAWFHLEGEKQRPALRALSPHQVRWWIYLFPTTSSWADDLLELQGALVPSILPLIAFEYLVVLF